MPRSVAAAWWSWRVAAIGRPDRRRPKMKSTRQHPEDDLQRAVFNYLGFRSDLLAWHPWNGGRRNPREAARMAGLGVVPGVPDVTIIGQGGQATLVELKAPRGRLSPAQVAFRDECRRLGIPWHLARSLDDLEDALASARQDGGAT